MVSCATCVHLYQNNRETQCRFNPPSVFPMTGPLGQQGFMSTWPPIQTNHYCGQHKVADLLNIQGVTNGDS